jgi:hypothetical protein
MPPDIAARPFNLPSVSFGPFRILEAVPWLMLAAALRIFAAGQAPAIQVAATIAVSFAIFLAFLLAARRMIEFADGRTNLGDLSFVEQLAVARGVVGYVFVLLFAAALTIFLIGPRELSLYMLMGLDGMAFDQFSKVGMVWSSILSAIVLLMIIQIGDGRKVALIGVLKEFARRSAWIIPAIALVAGFQLALSYGQGLARVALVFALVASPLSLGTQKTIFFFFVFAFAALRLWGTLIILTLALRESYRRDALIKNPT